MTNTIDPPEARENQPAEPAPATSGRLWDEVRPLLLRIHFYAGLITAPFILIAALTGLAFVVSIPIERAVFSDLNEVTPSGQPLPLAEQVQAARAELPDAEVARVRLADDPERSTRVEFVSDTIEDYRTVFIDPYTGDVLGVQNTNSQYMAFRTWLETFHSTLMLGEYGSLYSELAASWLWVIALVGVILWLTQRRKRRRLRSTLLPTRRGSSRMKLRSWHATVGLVAVLGIMAISATGLTWSNYAGANFSDLRTAMSWREDEMDVALDSPSELSAEQQDQAFDSVLQAARSAGLDGPVVVSVGEETTSAWVVSQDRVQWPMKQDRVAIDPSSSSVIDRLNFEDFPFMAKMATWGIWFHMGLLFGWVNQVALVALVLSIIWMICTGYRMWWNRRPTRGGLAGPPTTRRASTRASLVVLVLALVVGWAMPVLGVSLLLFLAFDVLRATIVSRRAEVGAD